MKRLILFSFALMTTMMSWAVLAAPADFRVVCKDGTSANFPGVGTEMYFNEEGTILYIVNDGEAFGSPGQFSVSYAVDGIEAIEFAEGFAYDGKYMTVKFESAEKVFVYPDAFEKYLTLADGTVSEEIAADIKTSNIAKQTIIDRKNAENIHSMLKGIVIPGKENTGHEGEEEEGKNSEQEELI